MATHFTRKKTENGEIAAGVAGQHAATSRLPSGQSRDWLSGAILVLAVILVYSPLWWAGYIWDDDNHVTANPCIVGPLGLKEIWTTSAAQQFPLVLTTFWLEHALWGLAPLPYHLVNVLLHAACAVVLWQILRSLQVPGAWLGAALWAVHPVEVESVAWISETKNTQSGLFFLLSILFFMKWLSARNLKGQTSKDWSYGLTLLFALLAMASKSSTVILPLMFCLCAWWVEGRWQWRNLVAMAPVLVMSVAASALTVWTVRLNTATNDPQWMRSWPERLITAGDAVWFYLGKLVWPYPLMTVYPRWQIDTGNWISYLPLLAVIITVFILWINRGSWSRPWFFAFAYFLTALVPVLGLVDHFILRYSLVFDHFQYLASMGPLALAGAGIARFADAVLPKRFGLHAVLCAGVLLPLGMGSWRHSWVFESEKSLWTHTLAHNPNSWLGCTNLGNVLLQEGQIDKSMALYQRALEIYPSFAQAHNDLGITLSRKGQLEAAILEYQKAVGIDPNLADAHYNLGIALGRTGKMGDAAAQFQEALAINPNHSRAHNNLGAALFIKGELAEAMGEYRKALEIAPNYAEAHYNLGRILIKMGRTNEAIAEYEKALEIEPNHALGQFSLGNALLNTGQVDEAIGHYQKALEIEPNLAAAHDHLGVAFQQKGRLDEAIKQFQEALQLSPNDPEAQINLAKAQALAPQTKGAK